MNLFSTNKGFTLLEILIAIVLSAIIITGVYNIYHTLLNVETSLEEREKGLMSYVKLTRIVQKDLRCMIDSPSIVNNTQGESLIFTSTHSLYFNSSLPVLIRYFLEKKNNKRYLMREETENNKNVKLTLRLLKDVDDLKFSFSQGQWEWLESPNSKTKIVRLNYIYEGKAWIITGGTLL
ncbi:MAG: prepilin-type N-terminal cleavage/methylation domain-containing protein [Nitrospirae bacterium]|nr:prepilin-type N-terminal cleavage/methylation domain-containing protein [Nitrospirota bacterium]